jgi:hypothetical protein
MEYEYNEIGDASIATRKSVVGNDITEVYRGGYNAISYSHRWKGCRRTWNLLSDSRLLNQLPSSRILCAMTARRRRHWTKMWIPMEMTMKPNREPRTAPAIAADESWMVEGGASDDDGEVGMEVDVGGRRVVVEEVVDGDAAGVMEEVEVEVVGGIFERVAGNAVARAPTPAQRNDTVGYVDNKPYDHQRRLGTYSRLWYRCRHSSRNEIIETLVQ